MKSSKNLFVLIFMVFFSVFSCSQQKDKELLFKAKEEIKKQLSNFDNMNYDKAEEYLIEYLENNEEDVEAYYLLGLIYQKRAMPDARKLLSTDVKHTMKSSDYFQKVIEINPKYDGEIFSLGPYSKITSIWGTLATKYIYEEKIDSARWAFEMGRKAGGFYNFILDFARNLLSSCEEDAILFTNGDNDTFPLLYLQLMENYRTDINVLNVNLLNLNWYTKKFTNQNMVSKNSISLGLTNEQIDNLKMIKMPDEKISLTFPNEIINDFKQKYKKNILNEIVVDKSQLFIYKEEIRLRVQDQIIFDIIKNNLDRPLYFSITCSPQNLCGFNSYLSQEGLAQRLVPIDNKEKLILNIENNKINLLSPIDYGQFITGFSWASLEDESSFYEDDNLRLLDNYVQLYLIFYDNYVNDKKLSREIAERVNKLFVNDYIPVDKFMLEKIKNISNDNK